MGGGGLVSAQGDRCMGEGLSALVYGWNDMQGNITNIRRANCSQTTGERLDSSTASHGLVTSGHYLFIPFLKTKVKWVRRKIGQAKNCIQDKQD